MNPVQITLFGEAVKPTDVRTEYDDRYEAAILDGCPRGILHLVSGKSAPVSLADQYSAVNELMQDMTLKDIAKITRYSVAHLQSLLAFGSLPNALKQAIQSESIKTGVAKRLLKLTQTQRVKVLQIFEETGELTQNDLDEIARVSQSQAVSMFPSSMFTPELQEQGNELERVVRRMASHTNPDEIRDAFEQAMELVFEAA